VFNARRRRVAPARSGLAPVPSKDKCAPPGIRSRPLAHARTRRISGPLALILTAAVMAAQAVSAQAQANPTSSPAAPPTPLPASAVGEEGAVQPLEPRIHALERASADAERQLGNLVEDVEDLAPLGNLNRVLLAAAFIGGVLVTFLFGWVVGKPKLSDYIKQTARAEVIRRVNESLGRIDPSGTKVFIHDGLFADAPGGDRMRRALYEVLQRMGFKPLPYADMGAVATDRGCVVYRFRPIAGVERPHESPDEPEFVAFLKTLGHQREAHLGFVVYAPWPVHGSSKVTDAYPIVTYANSVVTIASNVLSVARGLEPT